MFRPVEWVSRLALRHPSPGSLRLRLAQPPDHAVLLDRACRRHGTTIRRLPNCLIATVAIRRDPHSCASVPYEHLALPTQFRHREGVDEEQGIYRREVRSTMIALADLTVDVSTILRLIEGADDEAEEEDFPDA